MTGTTEKFGFRSIVFRGRFYGPEELDAEVERLAIAMKAGRQSRSPFVFLFAHNHLKSVVAFLAIRRLGLIAVPVDPAIGTFELDDLVSDSHPSVLVRTDPATLAFDCSTELEFLESADDPSATDVDELNDVSMMVYTAADDGHYKGALLTWTSLLADARACVTSVGRLGPTSVSCAILPYNHLYGFQTGLLMPLVSGCTVLIQEIESLRDPERLLASLTEHGVTNLYSVPYVYYLLTKTPGVRNALREVVSAISGGCKLSPDVFERFHDKAGHEIHEGYGLTEASPCCAFRHDGDPIRLDSVGRAIACCEIRALSDDGRPLPPGELGELGIRGANVMRGYFRKADTNHRVLQNGWLRTGDLGSLDTDGFVHLDGLRKRMLNVGGKKVYPAELERLLQLNENVQAARVFGTEAPSGGHTVLAEVALRDSRTEAVGALRAWCSSHLSPFKVPKRIDSVPIDNLFREAGSS